MFCCFFASNQANCPIILWSEMAPLGQKSTHPLPSSTHNWQCYDSDEMFTFSLHVWNLYFLHHSSYKISNSCYLFPPFTHLLYLYFCQTTPRIPPKGLTQRTLFFPSTSFLDLYICISGFQYFCVCKTTQEYPPRASHKAHLSSHKQHLLQTFQSKPQIFQLLKVFPWTPGQSKHLWWFPQISTHIQPHHIPTATK